MFKGEERQGKIIGYSFESNFAYFFFGTRFMPRESLSAAFPDFEFSFLRQVHGRRVVQAAPGTLEEADAHFTSRPGLAVVSQTADCVPVLLANDKTVCAIHSGWKGTAQNIVGAAKDVFGESSPAIAAIGPHILSSSFEVGHDVAKTLTEAISDNDGLLLPHPDPLKTYFDLTEMVRRQIRQTFGDAIQIEECLEDSLTNSLFHSFRRDKQQAGRQYSFVVLKS